MVLYGLFLTFSENGESFISQTPAHMYANQGVLLIHEVMQMMGFGLLVIAIAWGGLGLMMRQFTGAPYPDLSTLLGKTFVAALGITFSLALVVLMLMLMRIATIDILLVLSPIAFALWVLPQTEVWAQRWWNLMPMTIFQQAVQMLVLILGVVIVSDFPAGSSLNDILQLLIGLSMLMLTLKARSAPVGGEAAASAREAAPELVARPWARSARRAVSSAGRSARRAASSASQTPGSRLP